MFLENVSVSGGVSVLLARVLSVVAYPKHHSFVVVTVAGFVLSLEPVGEGAVAGFDEYPREAASAERDVLLRGGAAGGVSFLVELGEVDFGGGHVWFLVGKLNVRFTDKVSYSCAASVSAAISEQTT